MALLAIRRPKARAARRTRLQRAYVLPAVGIERRGAIRAHDLQVLQAVVIGHAIDVIEDQREPAAPPDLVLSAELTTPDLQARIEETLLQRPSRVGGASRHDFLERTERTRNRGSLGDSGIEVIRWDLPGPDVLAQSRMVATSGPHAKLPKRFRVRP